DVASVPPVDTNDAQTPPTLTTPSASDFKTQLETPQDAQPRLTPADQRKLMDLSQEIASLEARLDTEANTNARMPRVRRLTSVRARQSDDAYYLQSWTRKVEAVGNLNYPEEARRDRLYGSLRMLVTIAADGALMDVKILESSGHQVLDDAALRIVKMSAP